MTALSCVTSAAKGGLGLVLLTASGYAQTHKELTRTQLPTAPLSVANDSAIRPFRVNVPDKDLADLRRRIAATRWPDGKHDLAFRLRPHAFQHHMSLARIREG
jgi:hypothetical protein